MVNVNDSSPNASLDSVRNQLMLALQEIEYLIASELQEEERIMQERISNNGFYYGENCDYCRYAPRDPPEDH